MGTMIGYQAFYPSIRPLIGHTTFPRITRLIDASSTEDLCHTPHLTSLDFSEATALSECLDGKLPLHLSQLLLYSYPVPLTVNTFPPHLTHLRLWRAGSQPSCTLSAGVLPSSLISFDLQWELDTPLTPGVLPPRLEEMEYIAISAVDGGRVPTFADEG